MLHQTKQVAELNKTMEDMKSEHAFALHRKTAELLDELKQVGRFFSVAQMSRCSSYHVRYMMYLEVCLRAVPFLIGHLAAGRMSPWYEYGSCNFWTGNGARGGGESVRYLPYYIEYTGNY